MLNNQQKILLLFFVIILTCCSKSPEQRNPNETAQRTEKTEPKKELDLLTVNKQIIGLLQNRNYKGLAEHIHPEKGIRFSMYGYTDTLKNKHFSRQEFEKYLPTDIKFTWGERDGSGELLILSIKDYLETWVYKRDYSQSEYSENKFLGHGNSLNNLKEVYPLAEFTENYIHGTEKYSGMDWNALRLVFEKKGETWFLVAVINDQWTI